MLKYAIEEEMTVTPADFFVRRTGDLFFRINEVREWKTTVIRYMSERLLWTDEQTEAYRQELDRLLLEASGKK
ncbi:Aerobic glycerol-3-phosphate dehydrogenase [compost metagenome]